MSISVLEALRPFKKAVLLIVLGLVGFLFGNWLNDTYYSDASPIQPINFSHRIHATENEIPCQYCHVHAARSTSAGVPSVEKCMGCHKAIATDRPEIVKLAGYWERQEPIPWVKVHDVPDFVYFPHKRHIQAGLDCQTACHGPVATMDRVTRLASLKMPWCVDCHTEKQVEHGRDCWTCHK